MKYIYHIKKNKLVELKELYLFILKLKTYLTIFSTT